MSNSVSKCVNITRIPVNAFEKIFKLIETHHTHSQFDKKGSKKVNSMDQIKFLNELTQKN